MRLSQEEFVHLHKLAALRVPISSQEYQDFFASFARIIDFIQQLEQIPVYTSSTEPECELCMTHFGDKQQAFTLANTLFRNSTHPNINNSIVIKSLFQHDT